MNESFENGEKYNTIDSAGSKSKNDTIPFPNSQSADDGSLNKSINDNQQDENTENIVSNF